jgi:hypothetical protein
MKQMTGKTNELQKIESLKDTKRIQKEQLANKYDEMIETQNQKKRLNQTKKSKQKKKLKKKMKLLKKEER